MRFHACISACSLSEISTDSQEKDASDDVPEERHLPLSSCSWGVQGEAGTLCDKEADYRYSYAYTNM